MYAQHFSIIICATVLTFAAFPGCQPGSKEIKKNLKTLFFKDRIKGGKKKNPKINLRATSFVFCCDKTEFKQPVKSKQQEKYQYTLI